jgi:hypothetical protein
LLSVPHLRSRYLAHVQTIAEQWLDWNVVGSLVDQYRSLLDAEVRKDTRKLYSVGAYEQSFAASEDSEAGRSRGLSLPGFIAERRKFLLGLPELSGPHPVVRSVRRLPGSGDSKTYGEPRALEPVRIAAELEASTPPGSVVLYYAGEEAGSFHRVSMRDDGASPDDAAGDGTHTAEIPPRPAGTLVSYYVEVQAASETSSSVFYPEQAEARHLSYRVRPPAGSGSAVRINELLTTGGAGESEGSDVSRDWIELYNGSKDSVDLSGLFLSDDPDRPRKWRFPDGTAVEPRGFLIVAAGADADEGPALRTCFRLSRDGEFLSLVDRDERGNVLLDRVLFGKAKKGCSWGRLPDGHGELRPTSPTPGALNHVPEKAAP